MIDYNYIRTKKLQAKAPILNSAVKKIIFFEKILLTSIGKSGNNVEAEVYGVMG